MRARAPGRGGVHARVRSSRRSGAPLIYLKKTPLSCSSEATFRRSKQRHATGRTRVATARPFPTHPPRAHGKPRLLLLQHSIAESKNLRGGGGGAPSRGSLAPSRPTCEWEWVTGHDEDAHRARILEVLLRCVCVSARLLGVGHLRSRVGCARATAGVRAGHRSVDRPEGYGVVGVRAASGVSARVWRARASRSASARGAFPATVIVAPPPSSSPSYDLLLRAPCLNGISSSSLLLVQLYDLLRAPCLNGISSSSSRPLGAARGAPAAPTRRRCRARGRPARSRCREARHWRRRTNDQVASAARERRHNTRTCTYASIVHRHALSEVRHTRNAVPLCAQSHASKATPTRPGLLSYHRRAAFRSAGSLFFFFVALR